LSLTRPAHTFTLVLFFLAARALTLKDDETSNT
jgi:hypothetical protein